MVQVPTGFTVVDAGTITAQVDIDATRTAGVYDVVVVKSGVDYPLAKRFVVTAGGNGTTVTGNITTDVTWSAANSPYMVTGDISVQNSATLTLQPGIVVMFGDGVAGLENNRLRIDVGVTGTGTIIADGGIPGIGDPIVFTAEQPIVGTAVAGSYGGLRFGLNSRRSTLLRNVVVEYGGGNTNVAPGGGLLNGAVELQNSSSIAGFTSSIIRETQRNGLYLGNAAGSFGSPSWFENVEVTNAGQVAANHPISSAANAMATLGSNLTFTRNQRPQIQIRNSTNVDRGIGATHRDLAALSGDGVRRKRDAHRQRRRDPVDRTGQYRSLPRRRRRTPRHRRHDSRCIVGGRGIQQRRLPRHGQRRCQHLGRRALRAGWPGQLAHQHAARCADPRVRRRYAAGLRLNDPTAAANCVRRTMATASSRRGSQSTRASSPAPTAWRARSDRTAPRGVPALSTSTEMRGWLRSPTPR